MEQIIEKILSVRQASVILSCSEANVYSLIDSGDLPFIPVGQSKCYRISTIDLLDFIQQRKVRKRGIKTQVVRRVGKLKHIKIG